MLRQACFYVGAVLSVTARAQDGATSWATVPASRDSQQLEVVRVPSPSTEEIVTLVNRRNRAVVPPPAPRLVFSVDIREQPEMPNAVRTFAADSDTAVPSGALWPGVDGRITEAASVSGPIPGSHAVRNPWEVRVRSKVSRADSVFVCGGIIAGGDAAPIAFVNGKIERRGDALDGFVVDAVLASTVILDRNGTRYVLPLGRRTTISSEEP
jgi:hypothetical protein